MKHGGLNKPIHRWFQTKAQPRKQTLQRKRFEICQKACMTLTPGSMQDVTSDDASGIKLDDGQMKLDELVHLPCNWPDAQWKGNSDRHALDPG